MISWRKAVGDYVDMRCSLGFKLQDAKAGLKKFASFSNNAALHALRFLWRWNGRKQNKTARPVEWARRLTFVRGFARHWSAHDSLTEIPPYGLLPHRPGRAHPYFGTASMRSGSCFRPQGSCLRPTVSGDQPITASSDY